MAHRSTQGKETAHPYGGRNLILTTMNEKQQQLTFGKGISNKPSDILCDDNCLQESMNIVYRDGEHQPIQDPILDMKINDHNGVGVNKVLFIHKVGGTVRYIVQLSDNNIGWGVKTSGENPTYEGKGNILVSDGEDVQIQAIGKILVFLVNNKLYYFLWKDDEYKFLGNNIPEPSVTLYLSSPGDGGSAEMTLPYAELSDDEKKEVVRGLYAEAKNKAEKNGVFTLPFFARVAVELFDGTYTLQSVPTLLFPCVRANYQAISRHGNYLIVSGCRLYYKASFDYSDWADIVNGVSVFVTRGTEVNNFDSFRDFGDGNVFDPVYMDEGKETYHVNTGDKKTAPKTDSDIIAGIIDNSGLFYKLSDLGRKPSVTSGVVPIIENTLLNIVAQTRLKDDYYSHCNIGGGSILAYNNRLVVSNIVRSFYKGAQRFVGYSTGTEREVTIYVGITSENGERVIKNTFATNLALDLYFYYPDPRAHWVKIVDGENIITRELKGHPFLNGAYFFDRLPNGTVVTSGNGESGSNGSYGNGDNMGGSDGGRTFGTRAPRRVIPEDIPEVNEEYEKFANQLYLSEVNNPWNFGPIGNVVAGVGEIICLSTTTTAVSQGQFGQFPLIIFSTNGIWAASLNAEGELVAVHPINREVCNNPDSVTQTDGAVYFSSDKGLMVVVGNSIGNIDVRCVSEQLSGEFPNILKTAKIAYDYRDSLLWIVSDINRDRILGENCWIYNIKTGTFHKSSYFVGVNISPDTKTFNGFYSDVAPGRRVLPRFPGPVPTPVVLAGAYNKAALQEMVLDSLIGAIDTGGVSAFRQYQQVDDSIIYGRIKDTEGHPRTDLNRFYRYVSIFFAYPDENSKFAIRLYTKFENSDQYSTNSGQPRTDVLYYNNYYRFRWNGTRDGFDKVREFNGILAESPAEPTDTVEDGMLLGEEDGNDFDMIVPAGYSYNYGNKTIVFDPVRKRFILRWVQNYTKVDDSTTRDFTLYFKGSALLNDYVDNTNNYHPKTDSVYQDTTNETNYPLYRWDGSDLTHIDDTDVTQLYRISGTMEITLDDAYIIQHVEQGQTIETMSLRRGPVINCQEYDSAPYDEYDASRLQGHMKEVLMANLEAPDLDASANGVMFYTDGKEFVEQRSYSFVYNDTTYNGLMYYDTFQWGIGQATKHLPSTNVLYVLNGTSYYAWDGNDLVPTFAGLANIVNNYPDTLFHKLGDGLYSLTERPQPEDDTNLYSGVIETRPMKLENGLALKSIMQVRHIKCMDGTMTMQIFASNNLKEWVELHSLRGIPWLYYKFRFVFGEMNATDRFAGTMLITQERRTNKMR